MDSEENVRKYWAFISYSHADKAWADWLHRSLENYPMPRDLVGKPTPADAPVPRRFVPVFRDREELPTATDLGAVIARALSHARFLVVICSPRSARSPWVEKEILEYKRIHGESRVLCLIVDGEPWASDGKPGFDASDECFPKAVRFRLGSDGNLSNEPTEPIAADAREGKDGRENAVIKLMAGLLGVGFDDLRRREREYQRRRMRRLQATAAVFGVLFIAAVVAAVYAVRQKRVALRTLSMSDLNLAVAARRQDDAARQAAYLARSLRSDPDNALARMAAYSMLAHHKIHPPVGPALRHPLAVVSGCGSPDGKHILTASGDRVYLWSRPDNRLVRERAFDGAVIAVAHDPNGNGWVAGTAKGSLYFIGLEKLDDRRAPVKVDDAAVSTLAWDPAGKVLAVGMGRKAGRKGGELVLTGSGGEVLARHPTANMESRHLTWSDDASKVAVAGNSPYFYVCEATKGGKIREFQGKLCASGIRFSPDGNLRVLDILTGMSVVDPETGVAVGKAVSLSPTPVFCAFAPDGRHFVGLRRSPTAYIYEAETGDIPTEAISPAFTVSGAVYLDRDHVLLMAENGMAQVRRLRDGVPTVAMLPFHPGYPNLGALSPDGRLLAAACTSDSMVRIYDLETLQQTGRPLRFPTNLHGIRFDPSGSRLIALGWDGKIHRLDWRRGLGCESGKVEVVAPIDDNFQTLDEIKFQPSGRLAAVPDEKGVLLLDLEKQAVAGRIAVEGGASAVGWSPDGNRIAVATTGQKLKWFAQDGAETGKEIPLGAPVADIAWSPDSAVAAVLTNSDRVECYSVATGEPFGPGFPTGPNTMRCAWVSGGRWLAASDMNDVTRLWDVASGVEVARLPAGGNCDVAPLDLPSRGLVLLSGPKGYLAAPLPSVGRAPDWLPGFVEAAGGGSLGEAGDRPVLDPDAWMASAGRMRGAEAEPVWTAAAKWLLDEGAQRAAFPGAPVSESSMASIMDPVAEREFDAMLRTMNQLWKTGEDAKMARTLELMEEALKIRPGHIQLLKVKRQIAEQSGRTDMLRQACEGIAVSADAAIVDVLDARMAEARSWLESEPKDPAKARALLLEVLAGNPESNEARTMLEKIPE